jgi:NAD(P)-dependent dehydrogenase (short-subunit alcohol dehydrogenase family)
MTMGSVRQLMPSVISPPQCVQMAMSLLSSDDRPIIPVRCDRAADGRTMLPYAASMASVESVNEKERPAGTGLLSGKVCIVSGVGPGLGRQAARALAGHGADLVLAARRQSSLEEVQTEVQALGARAVVVPTNIGDPEACARVATAALEEFGGVDVLVNNAFRSDVFQSFEEVDLTVWRKIMDINLFGTLQMTRAVLPAMRERGGGSVVMVASMVTRQPQPGQGGYAISKGALLTATRVLADELGPSNVRVNAVVPGWMAGPSVDIYIQMTSTGRGVPQQVVEEELNARVPLGRIPSDADVAGAIVYLASDLSSAMTGQALDTNGGEIFA